MQKSGRSWDGFIEDGATIKDIDTTAIKKFQKLAVKRIPLIAGEKSAQAILLKLNLQERGKLRRAALLLFGKDPKKILHERLHQDRQVCKRYRHHQHG